MIARVPAREDGNAAGGLRESTQELLKKLLRTERWELIRLKRSIRCSTLQIKVVTNPAQKCKV